MLTLEKIRKYEAWIIAGAVVIYVVKRLFWYAEEFDSDILVARAAGISEQVIWSDLLTYNHIRNTIFPVICSGTFFLAAWYIFHFQVYPAVKEKKFDQKVMIQLFLVLSFITLSVFVYDFYKFYWRFMYDSTGAISGFKVFSFYRKLFVFTNTVAVIISLLAYEALAQLYYFYIRKIKEEEESYSFLSYILTGTLIFLIFVSAVFGRLPISFWNGLFADILFIPLIVITIGLAQDVYFKKILPLIGKEKPEAFLMPTILAGAIAMTGSILFEIVQIGSWYARGNHGFHFNFRNYKDIFIQFLSFSFISVFVALLRRIFSREKVLLKTAVFNTSAELSNLRAQINPHFLFNTLNTLYSVSLKENAAQTADGIQKLGDMMRFMLNENHQDRIPLTKEIEYLENYIEIQKMRIDESHEIEIRVNIQQPGHDFMIAPMLLNPFIENAFKHGISLRNPSWIYITLTHDDKRIYFKVHNSLHRHVSEDPMMQKDNNGVGLINVKKRLELIYTDRYTLDIQQSEHDYFISLTVLLS